MRGKFSAEPAQFLEKQSDLIIKSHKSWVARFYPKTQIFVLSQLYLDRFLYKTQITQIFTIHVMCILSHMAKLESMDAPSSDNTLQESLQNLSLLILQINIEESC